MDWGIWGVWVVQGVCVCVGGGVIGLHSDYVIYLILLTGLECLLRAVLSASLSQVDGNEEKQLTITTMSSTCPGIYRDSNENRIILSQQQDHNNKMYNSWFIKVW